MVEGRDLTFFVTVAEEFHFGRAASRLHITPASVTQRIQDLEAELAVRLFDRSSRRVTLTPAGRQLLPTARSGLQGLTAVTELARSLELGATGHARIGLAPNLCDVGARLIGELVAALPGLETVGASMWSAEAQDALLAGDIEVAVRDRRGVGGCLCFCSFDSAFGCGSTPKGDALLVAVATGCRWRSGSKRTGPRTRRVARCCSRALRLPYRRDGDQVARHSAAAGVAYANAFARSSVEVLHYGGDVGC